MARLLAALIAALILASPCRAQVTRTDEAASALLRSRLEATGVPSVIKVRGERLRVTGMLKRFYRNRGFMPAWSGPGGLTAQAGELVEAVSNAPEEGLRPGDYPLGTISALSEGMRLSIERGSQPGPALVADLDVLMTATFIGYGYHLIAGRIYPEIIDGEWSEYIWEADLDKLLEEALSNNTVAATLRRLAPPHRGYHALRGALKSYRETAEGGGWPEVPHGPKLQKGERGRRVGLLAERLRATGDLAGELEDKETFGDALEQALKRFQGRHGLDPDGVAGPRTLAALNVPVEARIRQLELNMERWRWLPEDLGRRYILVNVAAFELTVVEYGKSVMSMRIVAGKPYWHTPSFSSKMTYIVINPMWNVPPSIAVEEILPQVKRDPGYLKREGFKVLRGWGENERVVDPASVNWPKVNEKNFSFRFIQEPGPRNPLGRIKFMFPNRFNVYLHDTPSKGLFRREVRTFSHGCIRIEKPMELATYLLPDLAQEEILALIGEGEEVEAPLSEPIDVHSLYMTAWVSEDGTVNFREDVYGRDDLLLELLKEAPMTP